MATIKDYLDRIESAIYGKDVRQAIHDAIQQINNELEEAIENGGTGSGGTGSGEPGESGTSPVANVTAENIKKALGYTPADEKDVSELSGKVDQEQSDRANAISKHNTAEESHSDIRLLISNLTTKFNALANSDDTTLDQLSEIVAYIKSNKSLIDAVTTGKVNVSDIIDNLTTNVSNKPLSAKQGVALKGLIDNIVVPTLLSQLSGDSTHRTVTDAEKESWNKKSDFSGNYNDLTNKPSIPNLTGYATETYVKNYAQPKGEYATQKSVTELNENLVQLDISKVEQSDLEAEVENKLDSAKADIVTELLAQIGGMPIFGTINDDNTITVTSTLVNGTYVLMYENASGVLEEIGTVEVTNGEAIVTYTNLIPTANETFDGSGAVYNGVGYKDGYRLSSSYTEKANTSTTTFLTGFIQVSPGDTVYVSKGVCLKSDTNCKVALWKTDGNYDISLVPGTPSSTIDPMFEPYEYYDDGSLKSFTISPNRYDRALRLVGTGSGADAVITVNEPIE